MAEIGYTAGLFLHCYLGLGFVLWRLI